MYAKNLTKDNILKEIKNIISIQNPEKRLEAYDLLAMKLGFNLQNLMTKIDQLPNSKEIT